MYNIYAKYLTNFACGIYKDALNSVGWGWILLVFHDSWGLNFAFYLRCIHISQQRMNLRRDIIKRI